VIKRLSDRFWNYLTDRIEARMDLRPDRDDTLDLGSSDYQWRRVYVGPGSVSAPAVTLGGDTDTGIYQSAADNLDLAVGGVNQVNINSNFIEVTHYIQSLGQGFTVTRPDSSPVFQIVEANSYSSPNTLRYLLYYSGGATPSLVFRRSYIPDNGVETGLVYPFTLTWDGQAAIGTGSASSPSLTIAGDTNTGIYQSAADNLDITTGGTRRVGISSSGLEVPGGFVNARGFGRYKGYSWWEKSQTKTIVADLPNGLYMLTAAGDDENWCLVCWLRVRSNVGEVLLSPVASLIGVGFSGDDLQLTNQSAAYGISIAWAVTEFNKGG